MYRRALLTRFTIAIDLHSPLDSNLSSSIYSINTFVKLSKRLVKYTCNDYTGFSALYQIFLITFPIYQSIIESIIVCELTLYYNIYIIYINYIYNIYIYIIKYSSRDWSEIVWLPEISHFKNQPFNRLYSKKPAGMH